MQVRIWKNRVDDDISGTKRPIGNLATPTCRAGKIAIGMWSLYCRIFSNWLRKKINKKNRENLGFPKKTVP